MRGFRLVGDGVGVVVSGGAGVSDGTGVTDAVAVGVSVGSMGVAVTVDVPCGLVRRVK